MLKPCPFCGSEATIRVESTAFQIVACDTPEHRTMLCPMPTLTIYKKDGEWNYEYWNTRTLPPEVQAVMDASSSLLELRESGLWEPSRVKYWLDKIKAAKEVKT